MRTPLAPFALTALVAFAQDPQEARILSATLARLRTESPVVEAMIARAQGHRPDVQIQDGPLPGEVLGTTEPVGRQTIYITIDVAKVLARRESLTATLVHELAHADDMALNPPLFAKMQEEDKGLPWGQRRLEKRAISRTAAIMAYLAMQFPERYRAFLPEGPPMPPFVPEVVVLPLPPRRNW